MTGTSFDATFTNVTPLWPEPSDMLTVTVDPTVTEDRALVHVAGELDMATAPLLLTELSALADTAPRHVDLALHEVRFCDGSGLAVLLEGRRRIAQRGGTITLHDPCPSLRRILDICNLTLDLEPRPTPGPPEAAQPPRLTLLPQLPQN